MYADGTFKIAPDLFLQVYTIHCVVEGRCLPMVCCLLPRKTADIYEKLLRVVQKKMTRPPKSFTSDFELALIKAVLLIWPEVSIYLCFFHFKQTMWRKIQDLFRDLFNELKESTTLSEASKYPQRSQADSREYLPHQYISSQYLI